MSEHHKVVFYRDKPEDMRIATLSCTCDYTATEVQLLRRLSAGITNWLENTEDGQEAWRDCCGDFHIGCLHQYQRHRELRAALRRPDIGIDFLEVTITPDAAVHEYGTSLHMMPAEEP